MTYYSGAISWGYQRVQADRLMEAFGWGQPAYTDTVALNHAGWQQIIHDFNGAFFFFFICGSIFPGFHESSAAPFAASLFHRSGAERQRSAKQLKGAISVCSPTRRCLKCALTGLVGNSASVGVIWAASRSAAFFSRSPLRAVLGVSRTPLMFTFSQEKYWPFPGCILILAICFVFFHKP